MVINIPNTMQNIEITYDRDFNITNINSTSEKPTAPVNAFEENIIKEFTNYFLRKTKIIILPYVLKATDFQKSVYKITSEIPYGETLTYMEVANRLGKKCARAVGSVLKNNPLPFIIPCHRVVKSTGLGKYNLGTELKKYLIELEKNNQSI
ncbi:MAG: methylated-DNA--[protein]-cysteine S-methyltransferase [Ezakiella sp.]|nr:methylated-DNA--[protein]-cysteine S-methyltransferase [Ezakiella sp.]MDD7471631.1 methylated-DNA--[protein]-cysteine S-methyltransferase [Bacillota bacterium]MDY3923415.1 methylated-DNA--[protein]-cysteine S-methyltransferase [Ezakiella sp.]